MKVLLRTSAAFSPSNGRKFSEHTFQRADMIISKAVVVTALRERGQHDRAAFVDRELPDDVDTSRHGGLLAMLRLDPAKLAVAERPQESTDK